MKVPKNKDKFVKKLREEHNTGGKDNDALKPKKTSMGKILKGIVKFPDKLHVVGPVGTEKAKKTKKNENPLHGGEGSEFSER